VDGIKPADGSANNNKWLDFRAATNRTAADRDRVWLRIDFPSAQKVTHYNWATGNDSPERDPSIFRLQGSYNGADWTDLDLQSNYNATATRNAWVTNTGFAVSSANLPNAINDRANMNVKLGASILLDGVPETLGGLSGYGTVTLSNVNLTLSGSADATATFGGTVNGNGSLIKTGANTQSLFGTNLFAGDVVVQGGTLAVQGGAPATWFRLTIMKNKGNLDVTQFSEFALYSVDGVRRNLSLTQGSGTNSLLQGQFATPVAYSTGSGTEGPDKLFDNATGTKWCLTGNTPYVTNPATYRVVVMRLTNSTPEITGYNFCTANDAPDRSPVTWTLESSPNGVIWTNVDTRTDFVPTTSFFTWYNSSNAFTLANRAVTDGDTDVIPDSSVVEIRSGATLAVNNGSDTIGALRVDMLSAGTLTRLTAKTNGSLYLLNTTGRPASWVIPLSITSVTNPGALKSWKIYANGVQLSGYTLTYDAATGKFRLNAGGTLILVR
jgi:autotransporter-associated beta strand protein